MREGDDWATAAHLRQGLYRLTAAAFLPPTCEHLEQLRGGAAAVVEFGIEVFPFTAAVLDLADAVENPGDVPWLRGEHIRLFEAGVDGALCPPYESFYTGGGGAREAVATTTAELERTYESWGLRATGGGLTTPDHLVTELEVMSALCGSEAEAWARGPAEVADVAGKGAQFLRRHLECWLPDFARRVDAHARADLPRAATALALALVHHDRLLLTTLARQLTPSEAA